MAKKTSRKRKTSIAELQDRVSDLTAALEYIKDQLLFALDEVNAALGDDDQPTEEEEE